jgi:acetylornithine deacetylase
VRTAARLLETDWGTHPHLGPGTLNIGQIEGGVAPNVVADRATASVLLRAVEPPQACRAKLERCLSEHVAFESPFPNYGPIEFHVPAGEEPIEVAFGTDAPHLPRWGTPLLYGPGRILDAHTDHERVSKASFERAVADYGRVARALLERSRAEVGR